MDEDALICDLAQTYGIVEYENYPARKIGVLAGGLPPEARIMKKIAGSVVTRDEMMTALIFDRLNWLCWSKTKDAQHGWNRPESIAKRLMDPPKKEVLHGSKDVESFMEWRKKMIEG